MDAKVFRMAILMIISAFVLVLVIVYATNVDKLSALFGGGKDKSGAESTEEVSANEQEIDKFSATQIGDNLSGFELDADFFDPTEQVPTVVVRKKNTESGDRVDAADAARLSSEQEVTGTGMAIVGELVNPNPEAGYYSTGNFNPYSADDSLSIAEDGAMGQAGGASSYSGTFSATDSSMTGATLYPGSSTLSASTNNPSNTPAYSASGNPLNTPANSSTGNSLSTATISPATDAASVNSGTITGSTGYLTNSTYDDYIPATQTITGTPVGIP